MPRPAPVPWSCVPPCTWVTTKEVLQHSYHPPFLSDVQTKLPDPPATWQGKTLRIRGPRQRKGESGFFVYVVWALNAIEFALHNGLTYCIFLDGTNNPYWSDARHLSGTGMSNLWQDFFVIPTSSESRRCEGLQESQVLELSEGHFSGRRHKTEEAAGWTLYLQRSALKAFPAGDCPPSACGSYEWYRQMRMRGVRLVENHLRVQPEIARIADDFWVEWGLRGNRVLAAHCRGTDKIWGVKIGPSKYYPLFTKWLRAHGGRGRVFVATDDPGWMSEIADWGAKNFPGKIVWRNATRSTKNAFLSNSGDPYVKAVDVIVDVLLLSRADFLLKSTTNVAEMAIYFSPNGALVNHSYDFEIKDHPKLADIGFPRL
uniref:GT23 domain-containing protein n=1 Tax=Chrysotila carterae TaxID=13221 RepID=A0A7S4C062_CHRCT